MIDLAKLKNVDVRTVDIDTLVDIREVKLDRSLSKPERMKAFVEQIKSPYCGRHGDTVVKIAVADTDRTLEDCLEEYVRMF